MALTDNLISHWKMDEASGNALDAHGSNTLSDDNTVGTAAGKINTARSFDSASLESFSRTGVTFKFPSGDFTVSGWVYPTSVAAGIGIYGRGIGCHMSGGNGAQGDWYFGVTSDGRLVFAFHAAADGVSDVTGRAHTAAGVIADNTWYHVAAVRRSGANELWINGVSQSLSANVFDTGWANSGFRVGRNSYAIDQYCWHGRIDELSVHERALSSTEIGQLYNGGAGLAYPFSVASGNRRRRVLMGAGR